MDIQKNISKASFFFVCTTALVFPFSVAGTNAALGTAFLLSLFSGQLFKGITILKNNQPTFFFAVCLYLSLVIIGMAWSENKAYALDAIIHLNKWLVLPIVLFLLYENRKRSNIFIGFLSFGLTLHLAACVAQYNGWLTIHSVGGSSAYDATGYIGHIAFGLVYSIWAGWLFFWASAQTKKILKYLAYALSAWSFIMIFLAQGRSGYLIAFVTLLYITWHHLIQNKTRLFKATLILAFILIASIAFQAANISKNIKYIQTKESIERVLNGDLINAEARVQLWMIALETWQSNIIFGAGTSGYKQMLENKLLEDERFIAKAAALKHGNPHQQYLQALANWGIVGLSIVLFLLFTWFKSLPIMTKDNIYSPFVKLTALAMVTHGLTSVSLHAFHPLTLSMFLLALAFSVQQKKKE